MMSAPKPSISAALFLALLFMSFRLSNCINCHENEEQSLLSFKQSLKGSSDALSSWDAKFECCKWKGVVCSNLTGHVLRLDLKGNYLGGKISSSLLNLKHLKYLDLSQNNFEGGIPSFIGSLTSLEYLNLSFAGFHGMIPHNIGNLSNLQVLSLADRGYLAMQLEVSSLEWLSGLSQLKHLNMNGVTLWKATHWAQQVINKLPSLVELHFRDCNLNMMAALNDVNNISRSNLATLDLSGNPNYISLSYAVIPPWVFQLSNLIYLDMSNNYFVAPIPTMSKTTQLQHIDLSFNQFNSSIPQWLFSCKQLQYLDLSQNELSGKIPREIANLCNIQVLWLSYNQLEGEISDLFGNNMLDCFLGALLSLDLFENQLSGNMPPQFGNFTRLRSLNLGKNSLSGVIPNDIGNLVSLEILYLDYNKLRGKLPESIGKLVNLTELWIENNNLEGAVSETHFANLSNLKVLQASGNHLTLKVDTNWIPPFKLNTLSLRSWDLGSPFPLWLETQKESISELDLSSTGIYGNVPNWLWSLSFLNLSHNQLDGKILSISSRVLDFDVLHVFDLSSNRFSGPLPQLMTTSTLELHLSNNSFSGGSIPDNIGNMKELESLDFSMNSLSGNIPGSMSIMTSLNYLNLSYNHLTGTIPQSTQIGSFNESSFIGNNLCGLPLRISCKNDVNVPSQTQLQIQGRKSNKREIDWFYVFLSFGYAVGLSAILSALFFKKEWREAYYGFFQKLWECV
ncbi:disease resistance family protein / LRR family protein [Striga hermonthica]|uniref:Disease resistance family protein / LRR family protein n=1 Tax=Striga hermonthica TaxID=68872 RepID=A0A9N7REF3_STRHE|nr:disease resistance family protein / LRR family protein [Striga hermonthica]